MVYRTLTLFVRFFNIDNHQEAITSRREFMLIPAKLVKTSRQKRVDISVTNRSWERIKLGYQRIINWMKANAPQLNLGATMANVAIAFRGLFEQNLLTN